LQICHIQLLVLSSQRGDRHLCDRRHSIGPLTVVFKAQEDTGVAMKSFTALTAFFALVVT